MNNAIEKLAKLFSRFPGIGERQSKRFVYFLLHQSNDYLEDIKRAIGELKKLVRQCDSCFVYFESDGQKLCEVCRDPKTDIGLLLVVEKDSDYDSIRRSRTYTGRYFVLGGLVPIIEKEVEKFIRLRELVRTVETRAKSGLTEIILALSLTPQGEHSDGYLREILHAIAEKNNIKISSFGRGLSTGTEIEYSDNETLRSALENRQ